MALDSHRTHGYPELVENSAMMILTCHSGFEDIVAKEAEGFGARPVELRMGRVIVEGDLELIYRFNAWSRTAHRVLLMLDRFRVHGLREIYEAASSVDYGFMRPGQSFAVHGERHGVHPFTSIDVAATVGRAVMDSYRRSRGAELRVNLGSPDVIIEADLVHDELFLSLDTTGESLHIREWRRYNHPSSIKPSLSQVLLMFSGWRGSPLLDPFTGGATIPIEAALRWLNAPTHADRDYAYRRLPFYDPEVERMERDSHPDPIDEPPCNGCVVGVELSLKHYKGALKNVAAAGVSDVVDLVHGDSMRWEQKARFPYIVTNPPYGIRSGGRKRVVGLYERFARHIPRLLEKDGVVVTVTTEHKQMKRALESAGLSVIDERHGRHGRLWVKAIKAVLL